MTAGNAVAPAGVAPAGVAASGWRRALLFGEGLGIVVRGKNLEVAVVRVRPGGTTLLGAATISDFRTRPAAEWGAEVSRLVAGAGGGQLAATLVAPREEVIVRVVALPGVADRDLPGAIELQLDGLHPWEGEEVAWSWMRVGAGQILVGLVRRAALTAWETLFSEAGVGLAAVTFSAAAIHSAVRLRETAPASLLFYSETAGRTEVYGESGARAVYSAQLNVAAEQALTMARSELRLTGEAAATPLREALRVPEGADGVAWAAGAVSAATLVSRPANFLPPERRVSHSRVQYAVPMALAALTLTAAITVFVVMPAMAERKTTQALAEEARRLEPQALRAQSLERAGTEARGKLGALAELKGRTQADLEVLNELSRLLLPPVWTSQVEIYPDSVVIAGEADQAAPLLRLLDSSPLFQNSEFSVSVVRSGQQAEQFRIRTMRRGRAGRTTP